MADTIDSISIELTADVSSAESSINKLIGTLGRLKSAASGASNFNKITKSIASIAAVASGIDGSAGKKLNDMAAGLSALSKVGDLSNLKGAGKTLADIIKATNSGTGSGLNGLANGIKNTADALGGIKDADVSKLNAVKDALSGEMSGSLHTSSRASESASLGGMGSPEPSFGNMAAYGAMTVFKYVADSIRDATAAYREFQAALSGGTTIETSFVDEAQNVASAAQALGGSAPVVYGAMTVFKYVADSVHNAASAYTGFTHQIEGQSEVIETNFVDVENAAATMASRVQGLLSDQAGYNLNESFVSNWGAPPPDITGETAVNQAADTFSRFNSIAWSVGNTLHSIGSYVGSDFKAAFSGAIGAVTNFFHSLVRIAKYRALRAMLKNMVQSFKDLYGWSDKFGTGYAKSMDTINSAFLYLRNSIAAMTAPLINSVAPVLDEIIDRVVILLNWMNQLFAALSGAETYTVAKKVAQTWGSTFDTTGREAEEATEKIKRTIMGFDEINKLQKETTKGTSGTGHSPYTTGYEYMFEEKPLTGGFAGISNAMESALQDTLSRITLIVGAAELAVGAILALSGANVPLGLALMATGAVTMGSAIFANWEGISDNIKLAVAAVEAALGGGLAVGAILAFSGGNIGLGIGLMVAALSLEFSALTIAWNTIGDKMEEKIKAIGTLVGGALFGIGAVLAFSGHPAIGIPMMIAGAGVAAVSINWNYLKEKLQGPIGDVTALISGALLMLGVAAIAASNVPLGVGLLVAGAAGLAATVAANWNNLGNLMEGPIGKLTLALSGALLVLGFAAIAAAHVPLGLGLMVAGAAGLAATVAANWNKLKECIEGPLGTVALLLSGATLVLGFTAIAGGNIPLGVGLMVAGSAGIAANLAANWGKLKSLMEGPVGELITLMSTATVVLGFVAIAASHIPLGVGLIVAGSAGLATSITPAWNTLKEKLQGPIGAITAILSGALLVLGAVLLFTGAGTPLGLGLIAAGAGGLATAIAPNWDSIVSTISGICDKIKNTVSTWWDNTKEWFSNVGIQIMSVIVGGLVSIYDTFKTSIEDCGGNIALGILQGIITIFTNIGVWIVNNIFTPIINGIKSVFGIASPAKTMEEPGKNIALGILQGIINGLKNIGTWVKENIFDPIWNAIKNAGATVVTITVSLVEKVGEWASDIWNFITNTADTIFKTISLIAGSIAAFAGGIWDFVLSAKDTVFKTISLVGGSIADFAGGIWDLVLSAKDTIFKKISIIAGSIAEFAGGIWDFVLSVKDTVFKTISLIAGSIAAFAGGIWDFVLSAKDTIFKKIGLIAGAVTEFSGKVWDFILDGVETIFKTVSAVASGASNFLDSVWKWIIAGKETIFKTVSAVASGAANFFDDVWQWIIKGKETIDKIVKAGMEFAASWVTNIVDFILGPKAAEKTAKIMMTIGDIAKSIINFLQDPATATKNVIVAISTKIAEGAKKIWDYITGGTSDFEVTATGDILLRPKDGSGVSVTNSGMWKITDDINATANVGLKQGWSGTPQQALKINGLVTTVSTGLTKNWGNITPQKELGVDSLSTDISVGVSALWGALTAAAFLAYIKLTTSNLKTDIKVGLIKDWGSYISPAAWAADKGSKMNILVGLVKNWGATNSPSEWAKARGYKMNVWVGLVSNWGATNSPSEWAKARGYKMNVWVSLVSNWGYYTSPAAWAKAKGYLMTVLVSLIKNWGNYYSPADWAASYGKYPTLYVSLAKDWGNYYSPADWAASYGKYPTLYISLAKSWGNYYSPADWAAAFGNSITISVNLKKNWSGSYSDWVKRNSKGGVFSNVRWHDLPQYAGGGVITKNAWRSIPKYAGGTMSAHGSLFLAGEAGPELVGHVGGRTEVLNRSQLAATMFSAVRYAMNGVKIAGTMYNGGSVGDDDYDTLYRAMYDAFTAALAKSDARDAEKVALLRQINAKEFTAEVTAESVNRAQRQMNRRAGLTIVPVN